VRPETAWELSKLKNLQLPGNGTLQEFKDEIAVKEPKDLQNFLKSFGVFTPPFLYFFLNFSLLFVW